MIEVNTASSKIELLSSSNESSNHFPVRVSSANGEAFGLLKNYDEKLHALVVTQLTGDTDIKEGDVVQTSGLEGILQLTCRSVRLLKRNQIVMGWIGKFM